MRYINDNPMTYEQACQLSEALRELNIDSNLTVGGVVAYAEDSNKINAVSKSMNLGTFEQENLTQLQEQTLRR